MEREVALRDGIEGGVQPAQQRLDEGVAEAEGGGGEDVGDGGVQAGVVGLVGGQAARAQDEWQPVLVRDVLHFSPDNLPSLLLIFNILNRTYCVQPFYFSF